VVDVEHLCPYPPEVVERGEETMKVSCCISLRLDAAPG
jgi:hypothetical protein